MPEVELKKERQPSCPPKLNIRARITHELYTRRRRLVVPEGLPTMGCASSKLAEVKGGVEPGTLAIELNAGTADTPPTIALTL